MQWLLIGYMWLFIHRPFEVWPILGEFHIERIYVFFVIACAAVAPKKQWIPNLQHAAYVAFWLAILGCWITSPWMEAGQLVVENYFKLVVFYLLLVTLVHDEKSLRQVVFAFLVIMFIYLLHSLKEYIGGRHTYRMGIPRLIGVDATLGDPNSLGASIVYTLPLIVPFWVEVRRQWWVRPFLACYGALAVVCILLTGSRSSLIALLLCTLALVWQSKRRFVWLTAACALAPVVFFALPDSLQNRFETIINPDVGPENAKVSGEGRIEGFTIGMELFANNPLTGIGPGAWRPATKREIESHSLPGQLCGELGVVGLLSFLAILTSFMVNIWRLRRQCHLRGIPKDDFLSRFGTAIGFGVFLLTFLGVFGHNLFRYNWLWYGGFLIIALHCAKRRGPAEAVMPTEIYTYRLHLHGDWGREPLTTKEYA